jgi:hypothetical protein
MQIALRGKLILWFVDVVLLLISTLEAIAYRMHEHR